MPSRRRIPPAEGMTSENNTQITLRLGGSRAEHGVSLTDFENFIDSFLAALRDYDRGRRGEPMRKSGHPDRRAEAVTAFRLVRFAPGSGIATIEPERLMSSDDQPPCSTTRRFRLPSITFARSSMRSRLASRSGARERRAREGLSFVGKRLVRSRSSSPHIRASTGTIDIPQFERLGRIEHAEPEEARSARSGASA